MERNGIDLTTRSRKARVLLTIGMAFLVLIAAGCLASLVAGPEAMPVRLIAGAAGLLIVLILVGAVAVRRRRPHRLLVDHEGIRVFDGRGKAVVRLAWTELAGVGVMTNEFARARQRFAAAVDGDLPRGLRLIAVPIWLELFPAGPDAVARHPELQHAWSIGAGAAPGEEQRWLVMIGDGRGQEFPIGEAVRRWRPDLWRGNRSGSLLFGGHDAWLAHLARRGPQREG